MKKRTPLRKLRFSFAKPSRIFIIRDVAESIQ